MCLTQKRKKYRELVFDFAGEPQRVTYDLYLPALEKGETVPVFICVGGLPSYPDECSDFPWIKFANDEKIAILGLGFKFIDKDWPKKTSYQYAQVWSGRALIKILDILAQEAPIRKDELYFYGVSAGAQFGVRFALNWPQRARAVTAHAAGGYDAPQKYISTKFLITVGELDNTEYSRLEFAKHFTQFSRELGIEITLKIIPGIGHRQTEDQNEMSRNFIRKAIQVKSNSF